MNFNTYKLVIYTKNEIIRHKISYNGEVALLDDCDFLIEQEVAKGNSIHAAHVYNCLGEHIYYKYTSKRDNWEDSYSGV